MHRRTIAVGDLHLVRETPSRVVDDFESLVTAHRGARLIVAGDLFDLSADHPGAAKNVALERSFEENARVRNILAEHVERDGELWLLAGNHDSALAEEDVDVLVRRALGTHAGSAARIRTSPWFLREGGLHVEHGHLFDPDNATDHPLAANLRSLGVRFVEDFVAPTGAFRYLNANDGTPLMLFVSAFTWYGKRGPYVVYKYFDTAFRAVLSSGPFRDQRVDEAWGKAREESFFASLGDQGDEDPTKLRDLLDLGAAPTMRSLGATLSRLYLDRVAATCTLMSGLALFAAGRRRAAFTSIGLGALAMGASWALGHDRYGGTVPERLREGAAAIRKAAPTDLVVMGHAHRDHVEEGYANTGSFAFPRGTPGRPFLELRREGARTVAERRLWAQT